MDEFLFDVFSHVITIMMHKTQRRQENLGFFVLFLKTRTRKLEAVKSVYSVLTFEYKSMNILAEDLSDNHLYSAPTVNVAYLLFALLFCTLFPTFKPKT